MKNTYHFLHVGKTGGCAVIHALQQFRAEVGGNIHLHEHPTTFMDIPSDEQMFLNIRNPEKRFISAFYYVMRHHAPRETIPIPWNPAEEKFFRIFKTPREALEGLSAIDQTTRDIATNGLKHAWHMRDKQIKWVGGMDYLKENLNRVFHVNFNETLNEDFARLVEKLGLPSTITLTNDKKIANIGNNEADDKELSDLARENLKKCYAKDYEMYEFLKQLKEEGKA